MVFYSSCFEPAIVDRAQKREPAPPAVSPYGDYDTTLKTLTDQLSQGEYFLGDRFTALSQQLYFGANCTQIREWG
jgi:glutathione S-transferase